ncbi:MAG: InlB B-repeat-containing protein [Lachnospiraceae bacterium]|nr:InlB B-repeat-containing protein [Lachnospiraceae bacterium]
MKNNAVRKGRENTSFFTIMWRIMAIFFCVMMIGGLSSHCAAAAEATTDVVEMAAGTTADGIVDLKKIDTVRQGGSVFSARRGTQYGGITVEVSPAEGGTVELAAHSMLGIYFFSAVPNEDYVFVGWTVSNGSVVEYFDAETNPLPWSNSSVTITARFQKKYIIYNALTNSEKGRLEATASQSGDSFLPGTQISLKAIPNNGYRVVRIQYALDNGADYFSDLEWITLSETDTATFTMPENDVWVWAEFYSTSPHTLTLNSVGEGTITYNGKTSAQVYAGESVTLTVTPKNKGYQLQSLSGVTANYDASTHTFIMPDRDVNISGEFIWAPPYSVHAIVNDATLGQIASGVDQETFTYVFGAVPNNKTVYMDGWYDGKTGKQITKEAIYTISPESDIDIECRFIQGYIVELASNIKNGSLEYTPYRSLDTQYPENTCYKPGETIKLLGTPDEGYLLEGYYYAYLYINDNGTMTHGETIRLDGDTLTMDHSYVILANFVKAYDVSVSSDDTNAGTVVGNGQYAIDDYAQVTATAQTGYEFVAWTDTSGNTVSTEASYRFKVTGNTTLIAKFRRVYTVTVGIDSFSFDGTDATLTGAGTYHYRDTVTVKAIPADGSGVLCWYNTKNNTLVSEKPEYTFTIYEDTALEVMLWKVVTINVASCNESYGTVSGGGKYFYGNPFTITAQPKKNCEFVKWVDSSGNTISTSESFSSYSDYVLENETFTAIFQVKPGTVNFVSNGQSLNTITASSITASDFPEDPVSSDGYEFTGWDKTLTEINNVLASGDTITVTAQWKDTVMFLPTINMADYTGIFIYVHIPDGEDASKYTVETTPHNSVLTAIGPKNKVLSKLPSKNRTVGERDVLCYRIDATHLASSELTDTVDVVLKKNGVVVKSATYSVASIAAERIASGTLDEVAVRLHKVLIQYGYYAQIQFQHNLDKLPTLFPETPTLTEIPEAYAPNGDPTDFSNYITAFESKVDCSEAVSINIYLTPAAGYKRKDFVISVIDKDGNEYTNFTDPISTKGKIYFKINGIASNKLDSEFQIVVKLKNNPNVSATWTRSVLTAAYEIYQIANAAEKEETKNMVMALYQYFQSSRDQFSPVPAN